MTLLFQIEGRLFRGIEEHSYVYFVHSFYLEAADPLSLLRPRNMEL